MTGVQVLLGLHHFTPTWAVMLTFVKWILEAVFTCVKWLECQADLLQFVPSLKNVWRYTSTPWCVINHLVMMWYKMHQMFMSFYTAHQDLISNLIPSQWNGSEILPLPFSSLYRIVKFIHEVPNCTSFGCIVGQDFKFWSCPDVALFLFIFMSQP